MASQNTPCDSWAAGPPKRITATSVQISKISDPHNLISNDWRLWGSVTARVRWRILYRASPQCTRRTRRTNILFSFLFLINHLNAPCWLCGPCYWIKFWHFRVVCDKEEEAESQWHQAANSGLCVSSVSCFITNPQFPLDTSLLRCISDILAEQIHLTLV